MKGDELNATTTKHTSQQIHERSRKRSQLPVNGREVLPTQSIKRHCQSCGCLWSWQEGRDVSMWKGCMESPLARTQGCPLPHAQAASPQAMFA